MANVRMFKEIMSIFLQGEPELRYSVSVPMFSAAAIKGDQEFAESASSFKGYGISIARQGIHLLGNFKGKICLEQTGRSGHHRPQENGGVHA